MSFPYWTERLPLADTLLGFWSGTCDEWLAEGVGLVLAVNVLGALAAGATPPGRVTVVRRGSEIPDVFARGRWTFPVRERWLEDVPLPPPG